MSKFFANITTISSDSPAANNNLKKREFSRNQSSQSHHYLATHEQLVSMLSWNQFDRFNFIWYQSQSRYFNQSNIIFNHFLIIIFMDYQIFFVDSFIPEIVQFSAKNDICSNQDVDHVLLTQTMSGFKLKDFHCERH
jgi:hypothetical protein